MFNFLKKKDDSPPDVGKEAAEAVTEVTSEDVPVDDSKIDDVSPANISNVGGKISVSSSSGDEATRFEIEKLNAKFETVNEYIKGFNERFSMMNQQLGEVRAMSLSNEKDISKSTIEAQKAVDIVKEVKPEELRIDYQKMDLRANALVEKIEANKQFTETVMEELKELKRKAGLFEGSEALLNLTSDVKKDLMELQKMGDKVRMNADKSEQIFIELRKGFSDSQKTIQSVDNLNISLLDTKRELEKLKLDHSSILKNTDFNDFKKLIQSKFYLIESYLSQIREIKENNEHLTKFIEDILYLERENEKDIGDIGITLGANNVKKVSEYDERLMSILMVMEKFASEMKDIKSKLNMKKLMNEEIIASRNNPEFIFNNLDSSEEEVPLSKRIKNISLELNPNESLVDSKKDNTKILELNKDIENKLNIELNKTLPDKVKLEPEQIAVKVDTLDTSNISVDAALNKSREVVEPELIKIEEPVVKPINLSKVEEPVVKTIMPIKIEEPVVKNIALPEIEESIAETKKSPEIEEPVKIEEPVVKPINLSKVEEPVVETIMPIKIEEPVVKNIALPEIEESIAETKKSPEIEEPVKIEEPVVEEINSSKLEEPVIEIINFPKKVLKLSSKIKSKPLEISKQNSEEVINSVNISHKNISEEDHLKERDEFKKSFIKKSFDNLFISKKNDHDTRINSFLLKGGEYLATKDFINSMKICKEVMKIYNPKLDKDKSIDSRIMSFYDNILKLSSRAK